MSPLFLPEFRLWLTRKGLRPRSILLNTQHITWMAKEHHPFTKEGVNRFLENKLSTKHSRSHLNNYIVALRNYHAFCKEANYPTDDGLLTIKYFKAEETEKGILSDEEIEKILALPPFPKSSPELHQTYTDLFTVLAYTGARVTEISTLTPQRVDFGMNVITVPAAISKTNTMRYVPMAPNIVSLLTRRMKGLSSTDYIFPNGNKLPIRNDETQFPFRRRLQALGITRPKITPHSLRHSFITSLLNELGEVSLKRVMKIVGHKKIETTARYTQLTTKDIQETIKRLPLLKNQLDYRYVIERLREFTTHLIDDRFSLTITDTGSRILIDVSVRDTSISSG